MLLEMGIDPNLKDKEKNTLLHHFVYFEGRNEFIELAVKYGADINLRNKLGLYKVFYLSKILEKSQRN